MFSDRDYVEYGEIMNLRICVPVEESIIDPSAGPIEKEEMRRADLIETRCRMRRRSEKIGIEDED